MKDPAGVDKIHEIHSPDKQKYTYENLKRYSSGICWKIDITLIVLLYDLQMQSYEGEIGTLKSQI